MSLTKWLIESFPSLTEEVYGFPAWYWVGIILSLAVSFFVAEALKNPISHLAAIIFRIQKGDPKRLFLEKIRSSVNFIIAVSIFVVLGIFLHEPPSAMGTRSLTIKIAVFLCITHLLYRTIDLVFARWMSDNPSLALPLARRVTKTGLVVLAILLLVAQFGVDVSALLVGFGVGGLAIALAAKNILENLFGGAVLSLDQPFKVGDYCRLGDVTGDIEEMGVRSTRVRTQDRTLVVIPNSKLAEMNIENFSAREKVRMYSIIKLDVGTSLEQIKEVLSEFEKALTENDNFYHDLYRVRLIGITDAGFDIEIMCFAKCRLWREFVPMQEDLLFSFMEILSKLKVRLAVPRRYHYSENNALLD